MNILFHLIPKESVAYINDTSTLRQAMEKMEYHRYTAVPIINNDGKYVGVLREGDILWYIKNIDHFDMQFAEKVIIKTLPRKKDHMYAQIDTDFETLVELSMNQNFIPVVDDLKNFIGIVTRKSIINHLRDGKNGEKL